MFSSQLAPRAGKFADSSPPTRPHTLCFARQGVSDGALLLPLPSCGKPARSQRWRWRSASSRCFAREGTCAFDAASLPTQTRTLSFDLFARARTEVLCRSRSASTRRRSSSALCSRWISSRDRFGVVFGVVAFDDAETAAFSDDVDPIAADGSHPRIGEGKPDAGMDRGRAFRSNSPVKKLVRLPLANFFLPLPPPPPPPRAGDGGLPLPPLGAETGVSGEDVVEDVDGGALGVDGACGCTGDMAAYMLVVVVTSSADFVGLRGLAKAAERLP